MIQWQSLRIRFWLVAVLLVVALGAIPVARWSAALNARQSPSAAAQLNIVHPEFVYAVAIPTKQPLHWRWQVYLPPQHKFRLLATTSGITAMGLADALAERTPYELPLSNLPPAGPDGQYLVDVALERAAAGRWALVLQGRAGPVTALLDDDDAQWIDLVRAPDPNSDVFYGYSTHSDTPPRGSNLRDQPLVLLHMRCDIKGSRATGSIVPAYLNAPCNGLVLSVSDEASAAPGGQ